MIYNFFRVLFFDFFDFCVILNDMYFVGVIHIYKKSRLLLVGEPALWGIWGATPYLVACL